MPQLTTYPQSLFIAPCCKLHLRIIPEYFPSIFLYISDILPIYFRGHLQVTQWSPTGHLEIVWFVDHFPILNLHSAIRNV